ncbi:MAG: hypothetical protein DMD38_05370 [Gemmatimonadetes bacterium]|nr:MAG: hypothetical protein DMD38_05370 [Gemmatimonadota bacterium]
MERIELPEAGQHRVLETLQIWKHELPDTRSAVLPPNTQNPNPLVIADSVVASVFSPGAICSVDKESGRLQWVHRLDGYGGSCLSHAGGRIYAKSSRTVYCLDAASGHPYWQFSPSSTGRETTYSFPIIHGERVFFGDRAGVFHCLDARSGAQIWAQQVSTGKNNQVNSTAAIYSDLVVVSSNDAVVAAYDTQTGRGVWRQSTDGPCITELLMQDGKIFVATAASIYTLDGSTGETLFKKNWQNLDVHSFTRCPASLVVVLKGAGTRQPSSHGSSGPPQLIALSGTTEIFRVAAAEFIVGIRFDNDSGLIFESRLDGIGIVDPSTGQRLHNIYSENEVVGFGLVDVDDGRIYAMDMDRNMYCLRSPTNQVGVAA